MIKNYFKVGIWWILISLLFLLGSTNIVTAQYAVGDTVTDFTLNDVNGNSVSLFQFKGKVVVLNFFASW
jgi:peroxiredoxin